MPTAQIPDTPAVLSASGPISELVTRLSEARAASEAHAAAMKKRRKKRAASILGVVFALAIWICVANPDLIPLAIFLALVGTFATLFFVFVDFKGGRGEEDRCARERCDLAVALLQVLALDAVEDQPVTLHVDLTLPSAPAKRLRAGMAGRWKAVYFADRWLDLRGRLLDGSRFDLSLTEKHQKRERTQRGSSGKTKTKFKTKSVQVGSLFLKVKPGRHPGLPVAQEAAVAAVRLAAGSELLRLTVGEDSLHIVAAQPSTTFAAEYVPQEAHHFPASLFTSLYAVLRSARTGAEATA